MREELDARSAGTDTKPEGKPGQGHEVKVTRPVNRGHEVKFTSSLNQRHQGRQALSTCQSLDLGNPRCKTESGTQTDVHLMSISAEDMATPTNSVPPPIGTVAPPTNVVVTPPSGNTNTAGDSKSRSQNVTNYAIQSEYANADYANTSHDRISMTEIPNASFSQKVKNSLRSMLPRAGATSPRSANHHQAPESAVSETPPTPRRTRMAGYSSVLKDVFSRKFRSREKLSGDLGDSLQSLATGNQGDGCHGNGVTGNHSNEAAVADSDRTGSEIVSSVT